MNRLIVQSKYERKIGYLFLLIFTLAGIAICFFSDGTYGGGDSYTHYLFSRYSWQHPELLLHHWAKPFFTLLSSPFSQFGFKGIMLFNLALATATGFISWKIAIAFKHDNAWLATILCTMAPIYFVSIFSGLTEIAFAFILMLVVYMCTQNKYSIAACIASFLPLVRNEGVALLVLLAAFLIAKKKWKSCIYLMIAPLLYSIIGGLYSGDFTWLIHQNPYKNVADLYGKGSLFFFVSQNEFILGIPMVALFLFGIVGLCVPSKTGNPPVSKEELWLTFGTFASYFVAHSVFWWKGWMGSAGLIRVLAAVTPCVGLIALRGMNTLLSLIPFSLVKKIICCLFISLICWFPFKQHRFPRPLESADITMREAAQYIKLQKKIPKIYSNHPLVLFFLNIDPFDAQKSDELWDIDQRIQGQNVPSQSIVLWDSHFAPNEGKLSLSFLQNNPYFSCEKIFEGKEHDKKFTVYIFRRI